jgi:hypothetical protein
MTFKVLLVRHTYEKVDRDLFATIETLKKFKNCPLAREVSIICAEKPCQKPLKTPIIFPSFNMKLERIYRGNLRSKPGWFSGLSHQMQLFGAA